jgi:hypothetical protein
MSAKIIDHVNDPTRVHLMNKIASHYTIPDFVLDMPEDDLQPPAAGEHIYAMPAKKMFPIHNKAAAVLSAIYYDSIKEQPFERSEGILMKNAKEKLETALTLFGEAWPQKKAADDPVLRAEDCLVTIKKEDGTEQYLLPVRNVFELKRAIHYLDGFKDHMPIAAKKMIAEGLTKRIQSDQSEHLLKLGFTRESLSNRLEDYQVILGNYYLNKDEVLPRLKRASLYLKAKGLAEAEAAFNKVAAETEKADLFVPGAVAEEIEQVFAKYSEEVGRPNFIKITQKAFDEYCNQIITLPNASVVKSAELLKLKKADFAEILELDADSFADATGLYLEPGKVIAHIKSASVTQADRLIKSMKFNKLAIEYEASDSYELTQVDMSKLI